jgi:hypothetical protein
VNLAKRQARAKRRAKTMRLRRAVNIPCTPSKWGWQSPWEGPVIGSRRATPGEMQSARKLARRDAAP